MSDGPSEIDCAEALEHLYEYLDGELDAAREKAVRSHLAKCAPCLSVSEFESAYLRFLEARARARGAPEEVRRRILQRVLFRPDEPDST